MMRPRESGVMVGKGPWQVDLSYTVGDLGIPVDVVPGSVNAYWVEGDNSMGMQDSGLMAGAWPKC